MYKRYNKGDRVITKVYTYSPIPIGSIGVITDSRAQTKFGTLVKFECYRSPLYIRWGEMEPAKEHYLNKFYETIKG